MPTSGKFVCGNCHDHLEQTGAERAREATIRNLGAKLSALGVALDYHGADLDDFPPEVAATALDVLNYPARRRGLLVVGPPGAGKTRLAVALVKRVLCTGATVEFALARRWFRDIRATYRDKATTTESEILDRLCSAALLTFDDLDHHGTVTEHVLGALHEILDRRIGDYRPTVITTNLRPDAIAEVYDASIASRIASFATVVLAGADRRRPCDAAMETQPNAKVEV